MINLKKQDPIADAVKEILQQEALKGNQHKIDKNKNNKIDEEDFKLLRKEENVDEGLKDVAKKAFKALTGGSDEDQLKNLQKKMGLPQTGKKPEPQKEEVEQIDEVYDAEHFKYINSKEGDKHFEDGHATMMHHIGDDFLKHNAKINSKYAFKKNPHKKGTPEHKAWHHGADAAADEHISSLHEEAKWRKTSIAKKVTGPDNDDSHSYDYHQDNPRSSGMMKATSDTEPKYHSLSTRPNAQVASSGVRKGMITKQHGERLKSRIKSSLAKEEVEQIDELSKSTLGSYVKGAARDAGASHKLGADFKNQADKSRTPGSKAASSRLSDKFYNMAQKRHTGIGKAVERLTKEEENMPKTLKQFKENAFDWKKKPEPTPNGGSGVKQGSRYGGSKQKDKPEQETDEKK